MGKKSINKELAERKPTLTVEFHSEVLHRISVPTLVIDKNHIVVHWNKALENLTGITSSDMVGTNNHWEAFYSEQRPMMVDFIVDHMPDDVISSFYEGKYKKSSISESSYEAKDLFPCIGETGKVLHFTATPVPDVNGDIIGAAETFIDISEHKATEDNLRESEERYRELSVRDCLTNLYNFRHFYRQLKLEVERANRYKHPLSLILLDIDDFKKYNDAYGHLEGDKALIALSDVIRKNMRITDTAFRYGGEEFTILLPETQIGEAVEVAERLRKSFENTVLSPLPEANDCITASIGVTQYIPGEESTVFLNRVDGAMYKAKEGKNQVVCEYGEEETEQIPLFSD
jgi:diguanylate cyclase (GGDEF)-like protein